MALVDNKITEQDLIDRGYDLRDEMEDDAEVGLLIDRAWELLLNRIYSLNHDLTADADILALLDNADKISAFKWCQFLIIKNTMELLENPITDEVDACIRYRCRLSKMNGWQL